MKFPNATFTDEVLKDAIRGFKENNLKVYLTLAISTEIAANSPYPCHRWQLGDPDMANQDDAIVPENWPWDPGHPDHADFVESFWNSYTAEAVYFARLCEEEGVELYAPGAELDRLFRTRSGGRWPNDYGTYLTAMVDSIRSVYSGLLTYEMHWNAVVSGDFDPGSDYLWSDLDLDVIGISAYFQLADTAPVTVMSVEDLQSAWGTIFSDYLLPMSLMHAGLPMVFLEFGFVDVLGSPFFADMDAFKPRQFKDSDNTGFDDGEETQANIHEAFYTVNEENNRLVQGTFLWDNYIAGNDEWDRTYGNMRTSSVRNKLGEDVVRHWYAVYTPVPEIPVPHAPPYNVTGMENLVQLSWEASAEASSYHVQVSKTGDFAEIVYDISDIVDTRLYLEGLESGNTYY